MVVHFLVPFMGDYVAGGVDASPATSAVDGFMIRVAVEIDQHSAKSFQEL